MPEFWQMNVRTCPRCGSDVRYGGDLHECSPGDRSRVGYNLANTDEELAALSESVRQIYGIDEAFWYRNRPHYLEIVRRKRADSTLNAKG